MIRRYASRIVLSLIVLDQLVLVGAFLGALWLKKHVVLPDAALAIQTHLDLFIRLWPLLGVSLILAGAYDIHHAVGRLWPIIWRTIVAVGVLAAVWVGGTFFLKLTVLYAYSRAVFILFLALSAIGLVGLRLALAEVLAMWQTRTGRQRRVLIFGGEAHGRRILRNLHRQIFVPIRVVGVTGEWETRDAPRLEEEDALQRIRQGEVDHVIVDLPPKRIRLLLRVAEAAELEGVPLQITPAIFPGIHLTPQVGHIGRIPMIELCGGELPLSGLVAKRTLDVALSAIGLVVLSPLMLAIAAGIKLSSPGPIFYVQERVGLDGRRFRMLKFRSMRVDAESRTGPIWATADDPRRTALGRFMRSTNLDELPQLLNVLAGTMSLVGPRPERPEFVEQFKPVIERYSHKHWVKPGITGWAQVNGWRGQTDLRRRIEHDMYYIERWSIWFDLKIIFMTIFGRGYKGAH